MKLLVNSRRSGSRAFLLLSLAVFCISGAAFLSGRVRAEATQDASKKDDATLIESFRHVEVASVSAKRMCALQIHWMKHRRPMRRPTLRLRQRTAVVEVRRRRSVRQIVN